MNFGRSSDSERATARGVLASLLVVAMIFGVLQLVAVATSNRAPAFAQGTGSPAPPTIALINPEEGTSTVASDKPDANNTYHITAVASQRPSGALVEFELQDGNNKTKIGETVGVGDTFELQWDIPAALDDTSPTLRAKLFSNGTLVAEDEESIDINNGDDPQDPPFPSTPQDFAADTVEITYPADPGELGYYTNGAGNTSFLMDVVTSIGHPDNPGDFEVQPYYTVSAPGAQPEWTDCTNGAESTDDFTPSGSGQAGTIKCTLAASDAGSAITAVAAVVMNGDSNPLLDPVDSGDAHRVVPYLQDPSTVTISGGNAGFSTDRQDTAGDPPVTRCSSVFSATVKDQKSRKVGGVNVDVHAQGPDDNVKFNTSASYSDANKPPDDNHAQSEGAFSCNANQTDSPGGSNGGTQGEHEVGAGADIKHVESTGGTDNSGAFSFALHWQPDQTGVTSGGTQITAWADEDGNDLHCSLEASGNASVGWNVAPPSPTGTASDEPTCSGPSGSPTSSTSPSASPTTTSPTTGSPSTTPAQESRTVTFTSEKGSVRSGTVVTLSGQVFSNEPSCQDNEFIQIRRRIHGSTEFSDLTSAQTDSSGRFEVDIKVTKSADYVARAPGHDNCADADSDAITVLAKVRVRASASDKTPERGTKIKIRCTVKPKHSGSHVTLQRKKGKRFVKAGTATLNKRSKCSFTVKAKWKGKRLYRVRWPSQDNDHESNNSKPVRIKTHR